jgi:hypothetical protein
MNVQLDGDEQLLEHSPYRPGGDVNPGVSSQ